MRLIYYWVAMHPSDEPADRQQALDKAMLRTRELIEALPPVPQGILLGEETDESPHVSHLLLYLQ